MKHLTLHNQQLEEREGVKLEDGLYRGLMRRGACDELPIYRLFVP